MEKETFKQEQLLNYAALYKKELLENIIPFWEKYSIDTEHGGYFTCLDRKGKIYDTDKFIWLQARQVWTFSMLYNRVEKREDWLKIAQNGIRFLKDHGRDAKGNFYFSLNQKGTPLTYSFNIFSDCFAALAFGEYAKATKEIDAFEIAQNTYQLFLDRRSNPKGKFEKTTGARTLKSFGIPMMTAYLCHELEGIGDEKKNIEIYEECIHQILQIHYQPSTKIIYENVDPNGEFVDCFEGRSINPGHGIEAMWFLMDIAKKLERPALISKATDICLEILAFGWDEKYGGIFYFLDAKGSPPQQLEWDQKLWWVHLEALIALSKAYLLTKRADVWEWYIKVHDYTWSHFPDPTYGEWYGYLNRQGEPLLNLKGGKWKGCFHTPRGMYECWKNFA